MNKLQQLQQSQGGDNGFAASSGFPLKRPGIERPTKTEIEIAFSTHARITGQAVGIRWHGPSHETGLAQSFGKTMDEVQQAKRWPVDPLGLEALGEAAHPGVKMAGQAFAASGKRASPCFFVRPMRPKDNDQASSH